MCMAEGNKDRVGFLRHDTADSIFAKYSEKYGNISDYELLCKDGTRKGQLIISYMHNNITFEIPLRANAFEPLYHMHLLA